MCIRDRSYEIGRMCAAIHERKYMHDALLDEKLNPSQELSDLPPTREKILHLLRGKPSEYLKPDTVEKLCAFIKEKPEFFDRIEAESVLCHGDFGYGNIMLCGGKIYFIDFEFAYAGSRYSDIGRFFRRKSGDVQALADRQVCDAFARGYRSVSPLPSDWLMLAHLCDVSALLCSLTYDNVPAEWAEDVENAILYAIHEDKDEYKRQVQMVGRLVQHQQAGALEDQLGDGQPRPLAAAEHGVGFEHVVPREAEGGQRRAHLRHRQRAVFVPQLADDGVFVVDELLLLIVIADDLVVAVFVPAAVGLQPGGENFDQRRLCLLYTSRCV